MLEKQITCSWISQKQDQLIQKEETLFGQCWQYSWKRRAKLEIPTQIKVHKYMYFQLYYLCRPIFFMPQHECLSQKGVQNPYTCTNTIWYHKILICQIYVNNVTSFWVWCMRPIWSNTTVSMSTHTNWPYLILCMPDYDVDDVHSTLNYTLGEFFCRMLFMIATDMP